MTYNPYEPLRQQAIARANHYGKLGIGDQAAWFQRMAHIHHAASIAWMERRKAEIIEARRLQAMIAALPVAKIAPPLPKLTVAQPATVYPIYAAPRSTASRKRSQPGKKGKKT